MVYVVTAVHNRKNITEKFINQLIKQNYNDIQLIVVDDGSTDGTSEMVLDKMPSAVILRGNGNLWWGGALQLAYKYIKSNISDDNIVFIANDDTSLPDNYIENALNILSENPNTLLTGCGISMQTGKQIDGAINFDFSNLASTLVVGTGVDYGNCASTRSLFLTVGDFKKIGGFHPLLLPHYASDYEWTIRAVRKRNMKILCVSELKYYANEETTGDHSKSKRTYKQLFSKRSVSNPIYRANFYLLAAPWGKKISCLINQTGRMLKNGF